MAKFICSLEAIDKKLIIPLIYIIVHIFMHFYWEENDNNIVTYFIEYLGCALGETASFFVATIIKYRSNSKKNKKKEKNYFKDFSILFIIYIIYSVTNFFSEIEESSREFYVNEALEIIFISLVTYFILRYKYYIHHIISIVLITIIYLAFDLLLDNFEYTGLLPLFNQIIYVLADTLLYSYFKYLIEVKYYYFLHVLCISGIMDLFFQIVTFLVIFISQKVNNSKEIYFQFYELYYDSGIWYMIERFLFGLVFNGFIAGILEFAIMIKLSPNFILIGYGIGRIPSAVYYAEGWQRWVILFLSILQILSVLIYLEIIELNFCNLNNNTKRSISIRGKKQTYNFYEDEVIIGGYDFTEILRGSIELAEKDEEKEEENIK